MKKRTKTILGILVLSVVVGLADALTGFLLGRESYKFAAVSSDDSRFSLVYMDSAYYRSEVLQMFANDPEDSGEETGIDLCREKLIYTAHYTSDRYKSQWGWMPDSDDFWHWNSDEGVTTTGKRG